MSFTSNVAGRYEVYLAAFPPTGPQSRVSIGGAFSAPWSRDGHELPYIAREADGRAGPGGTAADVRDASGAVPDPASLVQLRDRTPRDASWPSFR